MVRQYLGRESAYLKRRYFVRQFSTLVRYLVIGPCIQSFEWYKTGLLENKRCNGRRQIKEITILNDVSSLFVLSQCVACSPKRWFCTTWMTSCKGPFIKWGWVWSQEWYRSRRVSICIMLHFNVLLVAIILQSYQSNRISVLLSFASFRKDLLYVFKGPLHALYMPVTRLQTEY